MTPEEKAVIEAAAEWSRSAYPGSGATFNHLALTVEALIKAREELAEGACGEVSPTGVMHCTLPAGHSLPVDDWRFRHHCGTASDGSARYWRELRP